MKNEILQVWSQLATAILNGTVQGLVLVLFVGLGLRLLGGLNAATRHAIWRVTLLVVILLLPANYFQFGQGVGLARKSRIRPELPRPAETPPGPPALSEVETEPSLETSRPPFTLAPVEETVNRAVEGTRAEPPAHLSSVSAAPAARVPWWRRELVSHVPSRLGVGLILAWLLVALVRGLLMVRCLCQLRRLKARSNLADGALAELFARLRQQMAVRRQVQLAISPTASGAAVVGFLHPMIVLPSRSFSESDLSSTEGILRHELAHVHRSDDWTCLQLQLVQAALFFHPGVWWISRQISLEREIACDDWVLHAGGAARDYALLLIESARQWKQSGFRLAPGASNNRSQLHQRINMILKPNRNTSPRLAKGRLGFITSATALLAVLAVCSGPRLVLAGLQSSAAAGVPEVAAAPSAAPAPLPGIAQVEPPEPIAPADIDSGPKSKSAPRATPEAPSAGVINSTPVLPAPRVEAPAPRHRRDTDAAEREARLEKRLDRLEKMVESLAAQQGGKRPHAQASISSSDEQIQAFSDKDMAELKAVAGRNAERIAEQAKRIAKQAQEQVARATAQAKREVAEALAAQNRVPDLDLAKKSLQDQLDSLQKQRDELQHQMDRLERQIDRIQQRQERQNSKDPFGGKREKPSTDGSDSKPEKPGV